MMRAMGKRVRYVGGLLGAAFLALNLAAFLQARAMLTYREGGARTRPPEALSAGRKALLLFTGISLPKPLNWATPGDHALFYQSPVITNRGGAALELWVVPQPQPRGTVLLLPGYGDCKSTLLPAAAELHRMGYVVCLADYEGAGGSAGRTTTLGYREAQDVQAVAEWLEGVRQCPRPLILMGHSMGAAAALRAVAELGVKADGLILASVFEDMLTAVRNRFHSLGWPAYPAAELMVFWGGRQGGFDGFSLSPKRYAAGVTCPALVLHGAADPRATPAQASNVFQRLAGPKRMEVFPGAKHESLLAQDRARWLGAVGPWLESLPRPAAPARPAPLPSSLPPLPPTSSKFQVPSSSLESRR